MSKCKCRECNNGLVYEVQYRLRGSIVGGMGSSTTCHVCNGDCTVDEEYYKYVDLEEILFTVVAFCILFAIGCLVLGTAVIGRIPIS